MPQRRAEFFATSLSSRARLLAPAALAITALAGGRASTKAQDATPAVDSLLEDAVTAMSALDSFSFELTTLEGETQFVEGITLTNVSGAVQRPDNFTATAEVELVIASLKLTIISADRRLWFTDPFGDGDTYIEIDLGGFGEFDPTVVINPDRLLLPALALVDTPTLVGEETLEDGTITNRIDGTVNLAAVVSLESTPEAESLPFELPEAVPFSVWIDADSLVRRIQVIGSILPGESDAIVRRVDLFEFNEPVDILPPD